MRMLLMSKNRRGLALSYAANLAVIAGCYCGARELARDARPADKDDLINSVAGGLASGALLGRFQGGQLGAVKYVILFAAGGTLIDFASLKYGGTIKNVLQKENVKQSGVDPIN